MRAEEGEERERGWESAEGRWVEIAEGRGWTERKDEGCGDSIGRESEIVRERGGNEKRERRSARFELGSAPLSPRLTSYDNNY